VRIYRPGLEDARKLSLRGEEVWARLASTNYLVSNLGRVYNKKTGRYLSLSINKTGYAVAGQLQAHRMVMEAFVGPSPLIVHHINHERADNKLHNLEYKTRTDHLKADLNSGVLRHRSGKTTPLPENADQILQEVVGGTLTQKQAQEKLGRSSVWVWAKVANLKEAGNEDSPLSSEERNQARLDAKEELETFWRRWPGFPAYEVSNLGRVRSVTSKKVLALGHPPGKPQKAAVLSAGLVYPAVMSIYGPPKPFEGAIICHYPDAKRNAIDNLIWGSYADNARQSVEQGLTPAGEDHPRCDLKNVDVEEALRRYVEESWNTAKFAVFLSISSDRANQIISGRSHMRLERPEELEGLNRREGSEHHLSNLTEDKLNEALILYTKERWSGVKFAKFLGISQPTADQILSGETWGITIRPAGFQYPWPDARSAYANKGSDHHAATTDETQIEAIFQQVISGEIKTAKEVGEILSMSRSNVHALLKGKLWKNVPRPPGLDEAVAKMMNRKKELSEEQVLAICERMQKGEKLKTILPDYKVSRVTYYKYKRQFAK